MAANELKRAEPTSQPRHNSGAANKNGENGVKSRKIGQTKYPRDKRANGSALSFTTFHCDTQLHGIHIEIVVWKKVILCSTSDAYFFSLVAVCCICFA